MKKLIFIVLFLPCVSFADVTVPVLLHVTVDVCDVPTPGTPPHCVKKSFPEGSTVTNVVLHGQDAKLLTGVASLKIRTDDGAVFDGNIAVARHMNNANGYYDTILLGVGPAAGLVSGPAAMSYVKFVTADLKRMGPMMLTGASIVIGNKVYIPKMNLNR